MQKGAKMQAQKALMVETRCLLLMELMDEGGRRRIEEGEERSVYEGPSLKIERKEGSLDFVDTQERKRGSDVGARRLPSQSGRERFEIWPSTI
jgi:hypothetical protein